MDNSLVDQVRSCGWPAYPALLLAGLALTSSSLAMFVAIARRRYARLVAPLAFGLALLPIGMGLLGTYLGRSMVDRALSGGAVDPAMHSQIRTAGYREAAMCAEIGVAGGLLPLLMAISAVILAFLIPMLPSNVPPPD